MHVQPQLSPGFCAGSAVFDPGKRNDGLTIRSCLANPHRATPTDLVDSIGQSLMETDSISTDHAVDVNMLQPSAALHRPLTRHVGASWSWNGSRRWKLVFLNLSRSTLPLMPAPTRLLILLDSYSNCFEQAAIVLQARALSIRLSVSCSRVRRPVNTAFLF